MKNIIYFLVIILFFSCSTKKSVTRSDTEQKIEQQNDITDTKASQEEVKKTVDDQSCIDSEDVTKTTNYDTSKPTDPTTGKPPILSETTTTHNSKAKANVKTTLDAKKKEEAKHKDNSKAKGQEENKSKVVEKSDPTDWKIYIYASLAIALLIAGFFFRGKLKAIFPFLSKLFS